MSEFHSELKWSCTRTHILEWKPDNKHCLAITHTHRVRSYMFSELSVVFANCFKCHWMDGGEKEVPGKNLSLGDWS